MFKDLTNVRQADYLNEKYPERKKKSKARLTARFIVNDPKLKKKGRGYYWHCDCDCGGSRLVSAKDFSMGKITKCKMCVSPKRVEEQKKLLQRLREIRRDLGDDWYSDEFKREWRNHLAAFSFEQRLLFETIMDGRSHWHLQMQAVDIVMRETDIELELMNYSRARVARARERLENEKLYRNEKN